MFRILLLEYLTEDSMVAIRKRESQGAFSHLDFPATCENVFAVETEVTAWLVFIQVI